MLPKEGHTETYTSSTGFPNISSMVHGRSLIQKYSSGYDLGRKSSSILLFQTFLDDDFIDSLKEIARGKGSGNDDAITLDVHAINKLQKDLNLEPTNEKSKYSYTSDKEGNYGKIIPLLEYSCVFYTNQQIKDTQALRDHMTV